MLLLNPEHLKATQDPLLPREHLAPTYAAIVRLTAAAVTGIVGLTIGYGVNAYLAGAWPFWGTVIPIAAFCFAATLTTVIVDDTRWHLLFSAFWGVCVTLALPWRTASEAVLLALIVAAFAMGAYWAYRTTSSTYTTLHLFTLTRKYTSTLATGVIIALIVLYGAAVSRGSALLPQGVLANLTDQAVRIVPTLIPGAQPSSPTSTLSVGDLAMASARAQLEADPRFRALGPEDQARVLAEAARAAADGVIKQLGTSGSASSSVGHVAQGAFSNILQGFQDRYGWYFTIAWLLGAFFIARSAAVLLTIVVAILVWMVVLAAVSAGLLRIEAIPSLHERVTL